MSPEHPHEVLFQEIQQEFAGILAHSSQGIYIYLDDSHWTCNDRLAALLGYATARELIKATSRASLLDAIVANDSRESVIDAYMKASSNNVASAIPVTWMRKDGTTFKGQAIFAPISFKRTVPGDAFRDTGLTKQPSAVRAETLTRTESKMASRLRTLRDQLAKSRAAPPAFCVLDGTPDR